MAEDESHITPHRAIPLLKRMYVRIYKLSTQSQHTSYSPSILRTVPAYFIQSQHTSYSPSILHTVPAYFVQSQHTSYSPSILHTVPAYFIQCMQLGASQVNLAITVCVAAVLAVAAVCAYLFTCFSSACASGTTACPTRSTRTPPPLRT